MDEGVPSLVAEPDWPEASARGSIEVELEHALPELAPSADEERALAPQDPGAPLPRKLEDPTENWLLSEDSIWD